MRLMDDDPVATAIVCEPDGQMLDFICEQLRAEDFQTLAAATAREALRIGRHRHPDLLVVDLEPADGSGVDLVRRIRGSRWQETRIESHIPILALLPRTEGPDDREPDLGADDYLEKPFTSEELLARVRAVLRRRHNRMDAALRVGEEGEILIDPARHRVMVGEREVKLTKKEFILLRALASDPTRVFSREELLRDGWGMWGSAAKGRTLDSHASRLRGKLDPEHSRYVVNCRGIGYSLLRPNRQGGGRTGRGAEADV
jgi:DNA-binding response OmpR family regulator